MSCTFWPERLLGLNLTFACKYHDWHYARQKVSRRIADRNLRRRIIKEARAEEYPFVMFYKRDKQFKSATLKASLIFDGKWRAFVIGWIMWIGVRLFGWYAWIKNKKEEPFSI